MAKEGLMTRLSTISNLFGRYECIKNMASNFRKIGKPGKAQPLDIEASQIRRNIKAKLDDLNDTMLSSILEISYEYEGIKKYARLTNLSKYEASVILPEIFKLNGYEVKILEIKEIQTFLFRDEL